MKSALIFTLASFLMLSGCASLGPKFSPIDKIPDDSALVYIYRVNKVAGSMTNPYVCVDGKVVGELPIGGYFYFGLPSGTHSIELRSAGMVGPSFDFTVVNGQFYFVRTDFSINNGMRESALSAGAAPEEKSYVVAGGAFKGGAEDARAALAMLDTTSQTQSNNPGFLMVQERFARPEIENTKLFKVPKYSKNLCEDNSAGKN